ncbi:MAG: hypothetical protein WD963_02320 [Candidatus Paceibacterota bacterium]
MKNFIYIIKNIVAIPLIIVFWILSWFDELDRLGEKLDNEDI